MPGFNKSCSVMNAFNFDRTVQERIGHILSLKIGEATLEADLTLKEPLNEGEAKCVSAISDYNWDGGFVDAMTFTGQVSVTNKNKMASLMHTQMKSIAVEIKFVIYEYDPNKKVYFECVKVDAAVKGLIVVNGKERMMHLSDQPGMEVQQPINFGLMFSVKPEDTKQDIQVAISQTDKLVKQWGVTRG